jgi:leader peptidase (prepilin peptidase) / N-methyltransferase
MLLRASGLTRAGGRPKIHRPVVNFFSPADLFSPQFFPWTALALGLIIGSFANVCIYRIPRQRSVVAPASACPACAAPIRPWDNVPVLSFLILGGRCRSCRAPIHWRYPLVEAAHGALYLALAVRFGPSARTLVLMAFVTALLVLSLIDLEHYLLPNVITLPGIALGLLASLLPGPPGPVGAAASALGGYLAFFALAEGYRRTRGVEGLGQGDWKMVAMIGAILGWKGMLLSVFLAALMGSVIGVALMAAGRGSRYPLPLGTFMGLGGIVAVFAGDPILAWYGRFFWRG